MYKERKKQKEQFDKDNAEAMTDDEFRRYYGKSRATIKEERDEKNTVHEAELARFQFLTTYID